MGQKKLARQKPQRICVLREPKQNRFQLGRRMDKVNSQAGTISGGRGKVYQGWQDKPRTRGINVDKVARNGERRGNQGRNHLYSRRLENVQGTRRSLQQQLE